MLDHLWGKHSAKLMNWVAGIVIKKYLLSACFALVTLLVTGERDRNSL